MGYYLIKDTTLSEIADKVRTKSGLTGGMAGSEIASNIDKIPTPVDGSLPSKTASNLTASGATVTVPAGYYASQVSKSVGTATQATPSIEVSGTGEITASATQSAGYVSAGTKSATKQLTTKGATTITPSTTEQTAVGAGVYTTGDIKVAALTGVDQATPTISVGTDGKITASSTQSAGYVGAGTKTATKQLTTQAGKTVTPTTSEQTAVSSGTYTTGDVKVGAMPTATQATPSISIDSAGKITAVATQQEGYVAAGSKTGTKQLTTQAAKTVTPSTSEQTAVASGVYTTGAVKVAAMSTATQATPSISVNSSGLITASATQSAGYVSAGTKSATKQLTTKGATTITPSTSSQTAVSSGTYTTGNITVGAIPSTYKNTSDANAVAREICLDKTAYVKGSKITGNGLVYKHYTGNFGTSGATTLAPVVNWSNEGYTFGTFAFFSGWATLYYTDGSSEQVRFGGATNGSTLNHRCSNTKFKLEATNVVLRFNFASMGKTVESIDSDIYYRVF